MTCKPRETLVSSEIGIAESDQPYPLTVEEPRALLAGMPEHAASVVKPFVDNFDGDRGTA